MTNEVIIHTTRNIVCHVIALIIIIANKLLLLFWITVILTFIIQARETPIHTIPPEKGLSLILPNDQDESDEKKSDKENEDIEDEEEEEDEEEDDESDEDYEYESECDDDDDSDDECENISTVNEIKQMLDDTLEQVRKARAFLDKL